MYGQDSLQPAYSLAFLLMFEKPMRKSVGNLVNDFLCCETQTNILALRVLNIGGSIQFHRRLLSTLHYLSFEMSCPFLAI